MEDVQIELSNCWNEMPKTEEVWGQCVQEMREALKNIHKVMTLFREQKCIFVESIKSLDPGKTYIVQVNTDYVFGKELSELLDFVQEICKRVNISFIVIPKEINIVSAPEGFDFGEKKPNIGEKKDV